MELNEIPDYDEINSIIGRLAEQYFRDNTGLIECSSTHPVSWLVAAAPFLSGSNRPMRWSAANLGTLYNAKNNPDYFLADDNDTLETRVASIVQTGNIGNATTYRKMNLLLQLILLQSYLWDGDDDKTNDRFNALNARTIDYDSSVGELTAQIEECGAIPEVDAIITIDKIIVDPTRAYCKFWFC